MNIGEVATASGLNAKMIRHYESIGLIPKASRTVSGYRTYAESDVHTLAFVRRARGLGFTMKEIKKLVSLWRNKSRASSDVKTMVNGHVESLEKKISELEAMKATLKKLAKHCHGDSRPDCPILDGIASHS
ncbi:MAG: Cu(I)-responsive transcriptional regulator [Proteobacteria bacterium]|nr:MAG: Cu(I)-responsive transcriptional regulator [Pseudomonadota bacterium]